MKSLHDALIEYSESDMYAFHMPGHKGILGDAKDITEIDGFDDLHEPAGIILQEMERVSRIYESKKSYILVGGSTLGNLVSVFAVCGMQGDLIIDRACHKSVYNASVVTRSELSFVNQFDLDSVQKAVETSKAAKAIVITAPTYEGYMPDVKAISDIAHKAGLVLIVDAAHGAHLGFDVRFPESPVKSGADLVIMSMHKTLPALTMTAVLHVCSDRVSCKKIENAIDIFETSSPSYLLMDSVSSCMTLVESKKDLFSNYYERLSRFYYDCKSLKSICVDDNISPVKDPGKIRIISDNPARMYQEFIEKYHLQPEMKTTECVLMMTSVSDSDEGFARLLSALLEMDASGKYHRAEKKEDALEYKSKIRRNLPLYMAVLEDTEEIRIEDAVSRVSGSYIIQYPPGSPLLTPGEEIDETILSHIKELINSGIKVTGLQVDSDGFTTISVVK